jgi:hypothetical protein
MWGSSIRAHEKSLGVDGQPVSNRSELIVAAALPWS